MRTIFERKQDLESIKDSIQNLLYCVDQWDDEPLQLLKWLFEMKRRVLIGRAFPSKFGDQLTYIISPPPWRIAPDVTRLPLPVFDLILQEHGNLIDSFAHFQEPKESSQRSFVCDMFTKYLNQFCVRNQCERKLISIQSFNELRRETSRKLSGVWERTLRIIERFKSDATPHLHYVVQEGYPLVVVWLTNKLYPEQVRQRDEYGRIPLHYSSIKSRELNFKFCDEFRESAFGGTQAVSTTQFLLQRFSDGATYADTEGKLPISMYLERADDFTNCRAVIQQLIDATPEVLKTRDPSSHLLPFMTAAMRRQNNQNDMEEVSHLTTIYETLKHEPSALSIAIDPNQSIDCFRGEHLRKKNKKLQQDLAAANSTIAKQKQNITDLEEENERLRSSQSVNNLLDLGNRKNALATVTSGNPPCPKRKRPNDIDEF